MAELKNKKLKNRVYKKGKTNIDFQRYQCKLQKQYEAANIMSEKITEIKQKIKNLQSFEKEIFKPCINTMSMGFDEKKYNDCLREKFEENFDVTIKKISEILNLLSNLHDTEDNEKKLKSKTKKIFDTIRKDETHCISYNADQFKEYRNKPKPTLTFDLKNKKTENCILFFEKLLSEQMIDHATS